MRVAAFGRSAGFIGMAVGLQNWSHQRRHPQQHLPALHYWSDFASTTEEVKRNLTEIHQTTGAKPKVIILGALGRYVQEERGEREEKKEEEREKRGE